MTHGASDRSAPFAATSMVRPSGTARRGYRAAACTGGSGARRERASTGGGGRHASHDLVIRSGRVVDGSGQPARTADVAIDDGVITAVGKVDGRGRREIDADGALVTPGYVDIHTHYDGQSTWDTELAPSSWHGVTTAVMGNCGVGFAPVRPADHDRLIELMEGVEDIPGVALHEGLSWAWQSFPEYLDDIDAKPARHRPRRPGPPRRDAPPRDGRARRQPRAGDARRHRGDGRAGPPGHRGRRPRLHDQPHAQPPLQQGRADAVAERRGGRARAASPRRSARSARACCRSCQRLQGRRRRVRPVPRDGRSAPAGRSRSRSPRPRSAPSSGATCSTA